MDGVVAVVAHHGRARTDRRPDIGVRALLSHAGFVAEPYFDRSARGGRAGEKRVLDQAREFFLKSSCAAASFFGWNGRGCNRVRSSLRNHRPIVRSDTVTVNRRATSSRKSTQRQRTTLSFSGSGPFIVSSFNSAICASVSEAG